MSNVVFRISAGFLVGALILAALSLYASDYYLKEQRRLAAAGDVSSAMDRVQVAASLDPFSPEPLQAEATLLQQQGSDREAVESLEKATARDPHNYLPYTLLGFLQMNRLNNYEAATKAFRKAQELNPNATFVATALAQSLLRQEKFQEAKRVYERLRKEGEISMENLYNLGRIYVREGQPEKGKKALSEALRLAEADLEKLDPAQKERRRELIESIKLSMADALVIQGRYEEARKMVAESSSEQAPAILSLLESDPELYRQSVKNGEIY